MALLRKRHVSLRGTYDIWVEGYAATGEHGGAMCLARGVKAGNFAKACHQICSPKAFQDQHGNFDPDRLTVWGCRLYPDERSARKTFG